MVFIMGVRILEGRTQGEFGVAIEAAKDAGCRVNQIHLG
jgi:hypothetical protein